ncbi:MAG: hypothetical protein CMJ58_03700 [Planctomycetaceae bacterium]|nr:hypothetical protein [Planctomycetaceae bacterium]
MLMPAKRSRPAARQDTLEGRPECGGAAIEFMGRLAGRRTAMATTVKKWSAITWLVVLGGFTVGALGNISLWLFGYYDPVQDDGVPPEQLWLFRAVNVALPLLFFATFRKAMAWANPPQQNENSGA